MKTPRRCTSKNIGLRDDIQGRGDGGIEALEVADLQNAIVALGGSDQTVGFVERRGHGLFDQHVDARFEQAAADAR